MAPEHTAADVKLTDLLSRAESCTQDQLHEILEALDALPPSKTRNSQIDSVLSILQRNLGLSKASLKQDLRAMAAEPAVRAEQESHVARLLRTVDAENPELWRDSDGQTYATVRVDSKPYSYSLNGADFSLWLLRLAYEELDGLAVGADVLTTVVRSLEARARFDGAVREAHYRVAVHGEPRERTVYLALHDEDQRVVEITRHGWNVRSADDIPVTFVSHSKTGAIPEPVTDGNVADLEAALGIPSTITASGVTQLSHAFQWAVAFLLSLFSPIGTRPIVSVSGRQGSGKSDLSQRLGSLVDPRSPQLQAPPKDEAALIISAQTTYVIGIDNVSDISPDVADALARLASGTGSLRGRKLYSDSEEHSISAQRSIVLNGIGNIVERDDVADRVIFINLPLISDTERLTETERAEAYQAAAPKALGLLLDVVAFGLKRIATGQKFLQRRPRLADALEWIVACVPALEWNPEELMRSFAEMRTAVSEEILESRPYVPLLVHRVRQTGSFTGSATDLQSELYALADNLNIRRNESGVPRLASGVGKDLSRLEDALQRVYGIKVSRTRIGKKRSWSLEVLQQEPDSPENQWTTSAAHLQPLVGTQRNEESPSGMPPEPLAGPSPVILHSTTRRDSDDGSDSGRILKEVNPPAQSAGTSPGTPESGAN